MMVEMHARGDQFFERVDAESAHGVNLLCDLHGAQFAGHAGSVAAGDHEAGQHGTEFLDHGEADQLPGDGLGAKLRQGGSGV